MQLLLSRMQKIKLTKKRQEEVQVFNLIYSFYEDTELEQF